jgi:hypothetical protein
MILLTLSYELFGIPRTTEEIIEKAAKEHDRIIVSYKTEQYVVQPQRNFSAYLSYMIYLILDSVPLAEAHLKKEGDFGKTGNERKKTFKLELENKTKTQFSEADPLLHETLDALQKALLEIMPLCSKYNVPYSLDDKTSNLLFSHSQV